MSGDPADHMDHYQNLGDMLNQVQYRHDSIVIKRDGKPLRSWSIRGCLSGSRRGPPASRKSKSSPRSMPL